MFEFFGLLFVLWLVFKTRFVFFCFCFFIESLKVFFVFLFHMFTGNMAYDSPTQAVVVSSTPVIEGPKEPKKESKKVVFPKTKKGATDAKAYKDLQSFLDNSFYPGMKEVESLSSGIDSIRLDVACDEDLERVKTEAENLRCEVEKILFWLELERSNRKGF